jgi:hypothetical protein
LRLFLVFVFVFLLFSCTTAKSPEVPAVAGNVGVSPGGPGEDDLSRVGNAMSKLAAGSIVREPGLPLVKTFETSP